MAQEVEIDSLASLEERIVKAVELVTRLRQEKEAAERRAIFAPYQVNAALMAKADPGAIFLHCLPAHRGEEVTDEVVDGPQSAVFDQAENRMHAQKAVLALLGTS